MQGMPGISRSQESDDTGRKFKDVHTDYYYISCNPTMSYLNYA